MSENDVDTVKKPDERVCVELAEGGGVLIRDGEQQPERDSRRPPRNRKKLPMWLEA